MRLIPIALAAAVLAATASAASGGSVVKVEKTKLGTIVATTKGRALYMWRADKARTSACYGQCATYWPPLLTSSARPRGGAGIQASLLGTTRRKDGKLQVTYAGHPLYTFAGDSAAGQANGEGSNGFGAKWYVLAPSGAVIDRG